MSKRWIVERTFAWLGQYHRLVVRLECLLEVFRGFVLVAFILICLRHFSRKKVRAAPAKQLSIMELRKYAKEYAKDQG